MSPELVNGLFGLAGAAIGVAGTWLVTHRYRETKRVAIVRGPLGRLVGVGASVRSAVEVLYRGQRVDSLASGQIAILNTGNSPVAELEVVLTPGEGSPVLDLAVESCNFPADSESVTIHESESAYRIRVAFLNRGDRVVLSYKLIGKTLRPALSARKLGVVVIVENDFVGWVPDIYLEALFRTLRFIPFLYSFIPSPYSRFFKEWRKRYPLTGSDDSLDAG